MSIDRVWRRRVVNEVRRTKPRCIRSASERRPTRAAWRRRIRDVQVLGVDLSEYDARRGTTRSKPGAGQPHVLDRGDAEHLAVADASVDGDGGLRGAQLRGPRSRAARTSPHNKPGVSRYPGVARGPATGRSGRSYEFYSYKSPRIGLVSRDKQACYMKVSSGFGRGVSGGLSGDDGPSGIRQVPCFRSQSFGIAQIYIGEK